MSQCVLVVDDDPLVLLVATETLAHAGYSVTTAADGNQAVSRLEAATFDLVITDVLMPDRDGLELTLEMRARWPATPIIAMSSGGRVDAGFYLPLAKAMGVDAVMLKPIRPARFLALVSDVLSGRVEAQSA